MPGRTVPDSTQERPYLLLVMAALGGLGCLSLILGTLVAQAIVPNHDWVADTISDLGAGRWEIVMDVALYGFAAGLFALALAAAHAHLGKIAWTAGVVQLALLGGLVIVVGARNEYGDGDSGGVVIHIYLVYALGALFTAMPLCLAPGLRRDHARTARLLVLLAVAWAVLSPLFLLAPDHLDGLAERALGLVACAMLALLARAFWRRGRSADPRTG
ncbi:DUF998 domain-containing protein [Roseivivax sp. CAU 1761]